MQTIIIYIVVAASAVFLLVKLFKPKKEAGCHKGCNCKDETI